MIRTLSAFIVAAALLAPGASLAAEENEYVRLVKLAQIRLHELGYDPGPINGEINSQTQAALAQFQQAWMLPVSGNLDEPTLFVLEIPREEQPSAAAGGSARR